MTGRELIIYILENHLENEQIFEDGRILGFMSVSEAALKFGVGISTICVWVRLGVIPSNMYEGNILIPVNAKLRMDLLSSNGLLKDYEGDESK